MSSLIGRFMRDLPYLRQNLVPQEQSGDQIEKLDYTGEENEKLTDDDVRDLAEALLQNSAFQGELCLNSNDLSDLAALHLAKIFEKQNGFNVTKLRLDGNNFTSKAGEYIGRALAENQSYPLRKLSFTGICLESIGLTRVIEAVNCNTHIKRLDVGVLTDQGLTSLAALLKANNSLEEITFQETGDHQKLWTDAGRSAFTLTIKESTMIKHVTLQFTRENEDADNDFKREIKFYTGMKAKNQAKMEMYRKVMQSCEPSEMFSNLQELVENNEEMASQMPVRKFYNNTFSTLLNRAIFALTKKQMQNPDNPEFFSLEGMVKFVAFQLLDSPPDGEIEQAEGELGDSV